MKSQGNEKFNNLSDHPCSLSFRQTHTFAQGEKNEEKSKSYRGKHALFAATVLHLKMFLFKVNAWGGGS